MTIEARATSPRRTVSVRADAVTGSQTLQIDAKAKALREAGQDVIGFGAGEPDFSTPAHIVEAARAACSRREFQKYGPTSGLWELRTAIARKTIRDSGFAVDPRNVTVTNGAKHAVFNALAAVLGPGDEVLLPGPYWNTFEEAAKFAGASVRVVPGREDQGFRITVDQLDEVTTARTRALIMVSPANPTGTVYSLGELEAIGTWLLERDLWLITDEIYEHLVYDECMFHSLPVVVPHLKDQTIVINGVSKTYAMTGWRVGWVLAPSRVTSVVERLQSHMTSHVCHVAQAAALAAISGPLDHVHHMRTAFDRRRRLITAGLSAIEGVSCQIPGGAFYVFPSFRSLLGQSLFGETLESTEQLAGIFLEQAHVAIVPGEAFGAPGYARLSYALGDDDLQEGVRRLQKVVERGLS